MICFTELQEAGLLPLQSKIPWQEEKHGGYSHKKKKKPCKEHGKHNKDHEHHRKTRKSQADKHRAKKHRRDVDRGHKMEEDFPRGYEKQTSKGRKKHHKSIFQAHGSKTEYAQEFLEAAKRKKKRKKQKDAGPDIDENLFLIKQRRKKSKQKSFY